MRLSWKGWKEMSLKGPPLVIVSLHYWVSQKDEYGLLTSLVNGNSLSPLLFTFILVSLHFERGVKIEYPPTINCICHVVSP